jgi:hypothetical protein
MKLQITLFFFMHGFFAQETTGILRKYFDEQNNPIPFATISIVQNLQNKIYNSISG